LRSVTLYGRPDCHLCDEAREILHEMGVEAGFELREIDIESSDRLFKAYLERIPVVEVDGVVVGELEPDPGALRVALGLGGP
jgi:glutaredoxin